MTPDFFESGGDSFLLFALIERLTKVSGLTLKTMDVIHADSVRGQAALLARVMRGQRDEPVNDA
jgi:hypothetical protein